MKARRKSDGEIIEVQAIVYNAKSGERYSPSELDFNVDAEGDEMLTVSAITVREMYAANERIKTDAPDKELGRTSDHINHVLRCLFGSKCLPDNVDSSEPNVNSSRSNVDSSRSNVDSLEPNSDGLNEDNCAKSEPNPTGPKESPRQFYRIIGTDEHGRQVVAPIPPEVAGSYDISKERTEPEENHLSDPAKMVDNIIRDGFSKERRLNIAVTIMGHIIQSGFYSLAENCRGKNITDMVKLSMQITDALMAECEKYVPQRPS